MGRNWERHREGKLQSGYVMWGKESIFTKMKTMTTVFCTLPRWCRAHCIQKQQSNRKIQMSLHRVSSSSCLSLLNARTVPGKYLTASERGVYVLFLKRGVWFTSEKWVSWKLGFNRVMGWMGLGRMPHPLHPMSPVVQAVSSAPTINRYFADSSVF